MPMTPGYYMPTNWPNVYPTMSSQTMPAQQSYAPAPQPQQTQGIIWVDGEVGAKAYQMPQGWPAGAPVALWDTNDTVIYLKSFNQMGMPNPLQKIHYTMEQQQSQPMLPAGQMSGDAQPTAGNYATKDDLEQMKNELKEMLRLQQPANQNGGNPAQNAANRGVNR